MAGVALGDIIRWWAVSGDREKLASFPSYCMHLSKNMVLNLEPWLCVVWAADGIGLTRTIEKLFSAQGVKCRIEVEWGNRADILVLSGCYASELLLPAYLSNFPSLLLPLLPSLLAFFPSLPPPSFPSLSFFFWCVCAMGNWNTVFSIYVSLRSFSMGFEVRIIVVFEWVNERINRFNS